MGSTGAYLHLVWSPARWRRFNLIVFLAFQTAFLACIVGLVLGNLVVIFVCGSSLLVLGTAHFIGSLRRYAAIRREAVERVSGSASNPDRPVGR